MNTIIHQETARPSAKIYQFPVGGRKAAGGHREPSQAAADLPSPLVSETVSGSGWYHDAAIQEAKRAGER